MSKEINKKSICFAVLSTHLVVVEGQENTFSKPRKELLDLMYDALLEGGVDKHDVKPNLCTSYYQMGRMEFIKGTGAYAHHKYKSKKTDSNEEEVKEPEVIIPEGSQWQAVQGETIEYFKNRQAATAFVGKNGGKEAWNVAKLEA